MAAALLQRPLVLRLLDQPEYLIFDTIDVSALLYLSGQLYELFEAASANLRHTLDYRLILPLAIESISACTLI